MKHMQSDNDKQPLTDGGGSDIKHVRASVRDLSSGIERGS